MSPAVNPAAATGATPENSNERSSPEQSATRKTIVVILSASGFFRKKQSNCPENLREMCSWKVRGSRILQNFPDLAEVAHRVRSAERSNPVPALVPYGISSTEIR